MKTFNSIILSLTALCIATFMEYAKSCRRIDDPNGVESSTT